MDAGPTSSTLAYYAAQGDWSDPKDRAVFFEVLPADLAGLCGVIQGVLIHDHFGARLYGPAPEDFARRPRETLPIADRLESLSAARAAPLSAMRAPFEREVGTCRDFALLLCAVLRHRGVPARVRCGFARYFTLGRYEDHWLCEYWKAEEERWALVDAQLDEAHRRHLSITFDVCDVPREQFMPPWRAWHQYRTGSADPELFGCGENRGEWFLQVNLVRDLLSLLKREVSAWDTWRDCNAEDRTLDGAALGHCDEIAALAKSAEAASFDSAPSAGLEGFLSVPPWQGRSG